MGKINLIEGILISELKIINHEKGNIFHVIRNFDNGFVDFGEAYISFINLNEIKAWKKHLNMTCNFIVPNGKILIVLCDFRKKSDTFGKINEFIISPENYFRLTVPPGICYGFKGLSKNNMLINIADIVHDPKEQINYTSKEVNINYNWIKK